MPGSTLWDLRAAAVFESRPFLTNAPPRDGLIELVPRSGEGLVTPFSVSSFGWTDEQENLLSYSFVRFPLPFEQSEVFADGAGGLAFAADFDWSIESIPKIDWKNSSSPLYFRKQGGLVLQTWVLPSACISAMIHSFHPLSRNISFRSFHSQVGNNRVDGLLMAAGSYFILVRARDVQGGEADRVSSGTHIAHFCILT